MKKRSLLAALLAGVMALGLCACGGSSEPAASGGEDGEEAHVVLKLGHMKAEGSSTDLDIKDFCAKVTEESGGTIEFEVYPSSTLGDYSTMVERMGIGDVDMMMGSITGNLDKRMSVWNTPYLARNWDEAREIFKQDGIIVTRMKEMAEENDFRILGLYPMYFSGIGLSKAPTGDITKLEKQNIKIRIPNAAAWEAMGTAFGFMTTPLNYSDIFTSMQTGVVDGTIGVGAEGLYSDFRDLIKYYLPVNAHVEAQWLCVGQPTWDKLSENQREILAKNVEEFEASRWETAEAAQAEYEQKLADLGVEVSTFTPEDYALFAKTMREQTWDIAHEEYGDELYNEMLDVVAQFD